MTLGQKIKQARLERGMTQKQLVGELITRNMLSKIENDSATPSVRTLEYLAARLDLHPGYFLADAGHSDGSSPDGLDEMRKAYREGRFADCIALLDGDIGRATTDEGYLLYTRASLAAAHAALSAGDLNAAREYAESADYYNKEGIYYSAAVDAEMSLILAECALENDLSEFEPNAHEYERAVKEISYFHRYELAKAEHLLKSGEAELASRALSGMAGTPPELQAKKLLLEGECLIAQKRFADAVNPLSEAEHSAETDEKLLRRIYSRLEACYIELEDYKLAHLYASRQIREK